MVKGHDTAERVAPVDPPAPSIDELPLLMEAKSSLKEYHGEDQKPVSSQQQQQEQGETLTDATGDSEKASTTPAIVVSSSKKSRPPFKYDPEKITLRFLFANRDGLAVTVECKLSDTVGAVKGALISVWPDGRFSLLLFSFIQMLIL